MRLIQVAIMRSKVWKMIMSICLMLVGHELSCIANGLGGGPNVGLTGSTSTSSKFLVDLALNLTCLVAPNLTNNSIFMLVISEFG